MSELITPNEFIQSDALIKALKDIAKEIENVLTQMGKATDIVKKHYTEVGKGATTIRELTENEKKKNETSKIGQDIENAVIKVQEKKYKVLIQNSEAVQKVTKELEEETKAQKKNELAQKASISSNEGLRAKIRILRDEKEKLIHTDKDYEKNLSRINSEINQHQRAIDATSDSEQKRTKGIGLYKEAIVKAYAAIQGAIILAKEAYSLFMDIMESTGATADAFTVTLEGWKQGFNAIKIAIASLDFENFTRKVKDAIAEGRRYAENLDEIDEKTRALKIIESETANEILDLRIKQNSALSTTNEKIEAGTKIIEKENKLQKIRTEIAQQAYDNELTNVAAIANGTKDVTDAMKLEIEQYVSQEDAIMKVVNEGKKYANNLITISELQNKRINGSVITQELADKYTVALGENNEELKKSYELYKRVNKPQDEEKYNKLVERRVELENAIGSAKANTLRIQSKLDSALNKDQDTSGKSTDKTKDGKENTLKEKEKADKEYFAAEMERLLEEEAAYLADLEWKWQMEEAYAKKGQDLLDKKLNAANENRSRLSSFFEEAEQTDFGKTEEFAQRKLKFEEDFNNAKSIEDEKYLTDKYIKEEEAAARNFEIQKEYLAQLSEYKKEIVLSAFDLVMALQDRELSKIEEKKNRELDAAGDNAKKKEQIEKKYAKQIADIKRKQAITEKAAALFQIGINTAQAITGFLKNPGGPAGIVLAVLAGVLGAIQAGIVASKPIPQFYKGVKNFEGGLAKVGERGSELVETKDRGMFLTPDTATDMLLPKGTTIYPHEKTVEMMGGMQPAYVDKLIEEQRLTRKLIASRTVKSTTITSSGWKYTTENLRSSQNHIDKYFRR